MEIRDTLGNIDRDHALYASCTPCRRSLRLDAGKLIERLGPDCDTLKALSKVVCSQCGRKMDMMRGHAGPVGLGKPR